MYKKINNCNTGAVVYKGRSLLDRLTVSEFTYMQKQLIEEKDDKGITYHSDYSDGFNHQQTKVEITNTLC